MQATVKNGRTEITLYKRESETLQKAADILQFVRRNAEGELEVAAATGLGAIGQVRECLCDESPEDDAPVSDQAPVMKTTG